MKTKRKKKERELLKIVLHAIWKTFFMFSLLFIFCMLLYIPFLVFSLTINFLIHLGRTRNVVDIAVFLSSLLKLWIYSWSFIVISLCIKRVIKNIKTLRKRNKK